MQKILIVEDEQHLADGLRFNLEAEGFVAEVAADGEIALERLAAAKFDAVVLDVMLPKVDGFDVARTMRERSDYTPILMLTARGRPEDVLIGFEAGTDDYLAKPFDLEIFLARLNGLLRRRQWLENSGRSKPSESIIKVNGRTIDLGNLELRHGDELVRITLMEAKLLRYLIEHEGRAVSRKVILEEVWQLQEDTDTRAIDNFIVRLRKHLEDQPNDPKIVQTVRGIGYKFVSDTVG
ncbi:MAG TPA: response regulator transcription factor [Pyrinomonadaceae bacterium]|nr:response regulator transcription factor [Chloracidobacterium sp.]MBP9107954.1 response regulator transcription factor [Pyrinomonadaceae bacterium]MBK7801732.1 response regulator transcription factor [Chloracidobacterium sp.]MBK9439112.1 response regulator transcription factor [Chloracidobacterium sp.]MBK9768695.1 response regulator transcription factor [Chloracidobacterium sp.]